MSDMRPYAHPHPPSQPQSQSQSQSQSQPHPQAHPLPPARLPPARLPPARLHRLTGGGGHPLAVVECGNPQGRPLLFLHGFAQSHLAFRRLLGGPLARSHRLLALDLRGHGGSQPTTAPQPEQYGDGPHWGQDVAAVLDGLDARGAVLIGWSYGGAVVADYLAGHDPASVAGIALLGACVCLGPSAKPFLGPGARYCFPPLLDDDFAAQVSGARALAHGLGGGTPGGTGQDNGQDNGDAEVADNAIAAMLACPLPVRRAIMRRQTDHTATFARWRGPALIVHGGRDGIILPGMAAHLAQAMPQARLAVLDGLGHAPFIEDTARVAALLSDAV